MPSTPTSSPKLTLESSTEHIRRLEQRVKELESERDHLVAVVEILQEISASPHFTDVLQSIARKLGETFGLDRCSIYLTGDSQDVRLVASYEDPTIRNLIVDLNRYPELQRAFESRETVFIPDATNDPMMRSVRATLENRKVRSIIVVPIQWRKTVIGAIFLRTERDGAPFSDRDVRLCQMVASLTAKALRNAHRFETLLRSEQDSAADAERRRSELQRIALVAFLRRLLDRYTNSEDHMWSETLLPKVADEELERLVSVAMAVINEESKG
jgi:two-component system sensor histidine kinase ChiS